MKLTLADVALKLAAAKCPEDVFGAAVNLTYTELAAAAHPDHNHDARDKAHEIFLEIGVWRDRARAKVALGTYGDHKPFAEVKKAPPPLYPQIIETRKQKYTVTGVLTRGDIADLYMCEFGGTRAVVKIAQSPGENDLLENESKALAELFPVGRREEKFYRYLPRLCDSFILKGATTRRRVNIVEFADGYVSLADVLAAYPRGLDYRDTVWMFKRGLAGLGFVHKAGFIHGGIVPSNVLVHPTGHGAKIIDWCYAVKTGAPKICALSAPYRDYYAPEVIDKRPPTPSTDIYMLAKCIVGLLGGDPRTGTMPDTVPKQIRAFMSGCLLAAQNRRPDSAWKLHEEFDELLMRLVGKPKYRPLAMPAR